ncbi:50S ribosomal protein L28 [Candidatus Sordicultor fermentans]|jgi:large subunit ribosomal protein L28|uniref:50S ribosomal protein L28 n=1 Tax=Candidatus Sordicultor fermentans TaxID=1953203 RepID=UPI0016B72BB0|nr:50S ribosomal protein L28 [Atribacterota bacterium]NLY05643.1 50S ribosomal protein L28 [Candidatus Atribacteria bacterium]MDI9608614.1 50S ribosomal protein L28 [Atribacterota bacterium]MDY0135025.1 50S ribosomal protein L28 [Atribacterota bacterium]HOQ50471.1 50S ribosomal protein L28 [Candidatus Atribacteria bacterium]
MAKCEICGKTTSFGNKISHSHRVSRKTWRPNIQKVRAVVDGETRKIKVCTSCLQAGKVKKA